MTKDEFLDDFMRAAGLPHHARTGDGVKLGSFHRIAVPCERGQERHYHPDNGVGWNCKGWLLIEPPETAHRGGAYSVTRHT